MTNNHEEICEHNSQLRGNYFYISLHFLFLPKKNVVEHWPWRWSCRWTALDHTVVLSCILESVRGGQMLWNLGIFHSSSIDSSSIRFYSRNTTSFSPSKLRSGSLSYLPDRAPSRRRRRFWHSWSDWFCHTPSLSRSMCALRNQSLIHQESLSGSWSIFSFFE